MINQNVVHLGGEVTLCQRNTKKNIARISINVPAGAADDDYQKGKTVTLQVDVVGDMFPMTEIIKVGDFFACKAQIFNVKLTPDSEKDKPEGEKKKWKIRWLQAIPSSPLTIIPDGGKHAKAAFNDAYYTGKVVKIGDIQEVGQKKTKMVRVTTVYSPKYDKNKSDEQRKEEEVWVDLVFFGSTAEKYVAKFCKVKDIIHVEGSISLQKEKWTSGGKEVIGVRVDAARDPGPQFETPEQRSGPRTSTTAQTDAYKNEKGEDDMPF